MEALKRGLEAYNRRDIEGLLEVLAPEVEWHPALMESLRGTAAVYRGHEAVRELLQDLLLDDFSAEVTEVRDLGERVVATGRLRIRGKASGAETESPMGFVADFKNGKATLIRTYLDPKQALEAVGLRDG